MKASQTTRSRNLKQGLIESLTAGEAYKPGFGVAIYNIPVTGGLRFNFTITFAQLRTDDPDILKDEDGKSIKYLSLPGAIDLSCAYIQKLVNIAGYLIAEYIPACKVNFVLLVV
jgi:hypothetical protein